MKKGRPCFSKEPPTNTIRPYYGQIPVAAISVKERLTEHELDHVMMGNYSKIPKLNKQEVADWKWMSPQDIKKDIAKNPDAYTAWFKIIFDKFYDYILNHKGIL